MELFEITAQYILEHYDLGNFQSLELIPEGVSSENYKVTTTKGIYFLKKHRVEGGQRIDEIEKNELFFALHSIPIILPLQNKNGSFHVFHEKNCYVFYAYIDGIKIRFKNLTETNFINLGETLARIHLLTKDVAENKPSDTLIYSRPQKPASLIRDIDMLLNHIEHKGELDDYDVHAQRILKLKKSLVQNLSEEMENFRIENLTLGHGDYQADNVFFDELGNVKYLFDLDMSGPMPRVYELVRSMLIMCFLNTFEEVDYTNAKTYTSAYNHLYPFSRMELEQALDLFFYKSLGTWREQAHYFENNPRTDKVYQHTLSAIEYLVSNRKSLAEEIYIDKRGAKPRRNEVKFWI